MFLLRSPSRAVRPTAKCAAKSKPKAKGRKHTEAKTPEKKTRAPKAKAKASIVAKAKPKPRPKAKTKPKAKPKKVLKQDTNNVYSRAYHMAKRAGHGKEEAGLFERQP